jgi:fructoselysine 6-kinase
MCGMGRPPLRIVSVGECTIDHYLDLKQDFIGGISLNFAVHSKRCGAEKVSLVSRIGNDHGARILQKLAKEGIDTSHVSVQPGATARQNIELTADGERVFPPGGYLPGVLEFYSLEETAVHFIQRHNVLVSALFKQIEPLFRQVMETIPFEGWRVADFLDLADYDIGIVEQILRQLTIAFLSVDYEMVEQLRPLSRKAGGLIVVTLGKEGSAALRKGEPMFQPAVRPDKVVDTTGCGDAFQAAFTVSYWRNGDLQRALEDGAQWAADVLRHRGAID